MPRLMGGGLCLRQQVWHGTARSVTHTVARPRSGGRRGGAGAVRGPSRDAPMVATVRSFVLIRESTAHTFLVASRAYIVAQL